MRARPLRTRFSPRDAAAARIGCQDSEVVSLVETGFVTIDTRSNESVAQSIKRPHANRGTCRRHRKLRRDPRRTHQKRSKTLAAFACLSRAYAFPSYADKTLRRGVGLCRIGLNEFVQTVSCR